VSPVQVSPLSFLFLYFIYFNLFTYLFYLFSGLLLVSIWFSDFPRFYTFVVSELPPAANQPKVRNSEA